MDRIEVADCAVVVIDAQDGFYGPTRSDVDRPALRQALDRAAWVCAVAVAQQVPVLVTEEDAGTNGRTDARVRAAIGHADTFDKPVFGAADNPAIDAAVRATGRGTVILVGMETDVCVAQSALGWRDSGLRVVVVHDAVFSAGPAHEFGLQRMTRERIDLVSAKELYYEWLRTLAAVRAFDARYPTLASPPGFSL